jgi:hypothetical protein
MASSISVTKVRAYPPPGRFARARARINIVSSASQSPVNTSMGPPATISRAAVGRSSKYPEQFAIRMGLAIGDLLGGLSPRSARRPVAGLASGPIRGAANWHTDNIDGNILQ